MNDAPHPPHTACPRHAAKAWPGSTLAGLLLTLLLLGSGCTSTGVTPSCDPSGSGDAGAGGSCNPKAICVNENNQQVDPKECCPGLTGPALQTCLDGFDSTP